MERIAPHPGRFLKSVKTQDLGDTELGRMYGKLEVEEKGYGVFGKDVILKKLEGGRLLRM
jgi:hypothetical protein